MSVSYTAQDSSMSFRIPSTLKSDFDRFLNMDVPNTVRNFTLYHNWYDKDTTGFTAPVIRGEIYPDPTKSRYVNTDNNLNFRASLDSGIMKGDIIIDPDGEVYTFDWEVNHEMNNSPTRALRCNSYLVVKRYVNEEVDERGYLVTEGGWQTVVPSIPCNMYRYEGRPEYVVESGSAGIVPNSITVVTVQVNTTTKNIRVDDVFQWGNDEYLVIDVNRVGVSIDGNHGVLSLQAKKKSGGII